MNASSVPLEEALPWSIETQRTILVCDSVETDGRFLLHALAKQVLTTTPTTGHGSSGDGISDTGAAEGRVLWLGCGPITDRQVATALKKIGCDVAAMYLRGHHNNNNPRSSTSSSSSSSSIMPTLTIRSLAVEMAASLVTSTSLHGSIDGDPTAGESSKEWNAEVFVRDLYKQVKKWVIEEQQQNQQPGRQRLPSWIILDDVSSLATMLGDPRPVYKLIHSLNALSSSLEGDFGFGLAIRCSHDFDQQFYTQNQLDGQNPNANVNAKAANTGWVGLGGNCNSSSNISQLNSYIPWERHLVELADGIVDVVPLASGYSREAHGRLLFTVHPSGRGWKESVATMAPGAGTRPKNINDNGFLWTSLAINYAITDNGVRAIRLRPSTSR